MTDAEMKEENLRIDTAPLGHVEGWRLTLTHVPSGIATVEEGDGSLIKMRAKAFVRLRTVLAAFTRLAAADAVVTAAREWADSQCSRLADCDGQIGQHDVLCAKTTAEANLYGVTAALDAAGMEG